MSGKWKGKEISKMSEEEIEKAVELLISESIKMSRWLGKVCNEIDDFNEELKFRNEKTTDLEL